MPHIRASGIGYLASKNFEVTDSKGNVLTNYTAEAVAHGGVHGPRETRPQELARPRQIHVPQPVRHLPALHAGAGALQPHPPRLLPRLRPRAEARDLAVWVLPTADQGGDWDLDKVHDAMNSGPTTTPSASKRRSPSSSSTSPPSSPKTASPLLRRHLRLRRRDAASPRQRPTLSHETLPFHSQAQNRRCPVSPHLINYRLCFQVTQGFSLGPLFDTRSRGFSPWVTPFIPPANPPTRYTFLVKNADFNPKVDAYIAKAQPFAQPILTHIRGSRAQGLPRGRRSHQVEHALLHPPRQSSSVTWPRSSNTVPSVSGARR